MSRTMGMFVSLLDHDKVVAYLRKWGADNGWDNADRIEAERLVLVRGKNGLSTVCSEGVGWHEKDGQLALYYVSGMWSDIAYFPTEDVLSMVSGETVDIAEFVRTFGSRLDTNCFIWQNEIAGFSQNILEFV